MKKQREISALEAHLGYWLRFVSNHVSHAFSLQLEQHGVTVAEWVVMRELWRLQHTTPQVKPSTLAISLGLTRGAVSKLIERLVSKGLVDRSSGEGDRRYQNIELTSAGLGLVPQLADLADQNDARFFGHLDEGQHQALIGLLQDIVERHRLKKPPLG